MVTKKSEKTEGFNTSLVSYIISIVALVEAIVSPVAGIVLGIIGLSFSNKKDDSLAKRAKKMNIIAIILGILIFVLILIVSALSTSLANGVIAQ